MSKKHNTHVSNVLVIGSGGAGLRAAIEAKSKGVEVEGRNPDEIKQDIHESE